MARPRWSIAGLMALIVCVAVNFAALRLLWDWKPILLAGLILSGPLLQLGIWRLVRGPGAWRPFWAGAVVCGLIVAGTFVYAMLTPPTIALAGRRYVVGYRGSPLWWLWDRRYGDSLFTPLESWLVHLHVQPGMKPLLTVLVVLVWSAPQIVAAAGGGLVAHVMFSRLYKTTTRERCAESDGTLPPGEADSGASAP